MRHKLQQGTLDNSVRKKDRSKDGENSLLNSCSSAMQRKAGHCPTRQTGKLTGIIGGKNYATYGFTSKAVNTETG